MEVRTWAENQVPLGHGPASASAVRLAMILAPQAEVTIFHAFSVPFENTLALAGVTNEYIERYRVEARHEAMDLIRSLSVMSLWSMSSTVETGSNPRATCDPDEPIRVTGGYRSLARSQKQTAA